MGKKKEKETAKRPTSKNEKSKRPKKTNGSKKRRRKKEIAGKKKETSDKKRVASGSGLQTCPCCKKHCSLISPKCGKGRKLAKKLGL